VIPPFMPTPPPSSLLAFTGVCRDGPWKGQFLANNVRFVPVRAPWGIVGQYCNDGVGRWNWIKLETPK
jgi:hypothetical protein